jgi:putative flavoprotein involved in K+ transport
VILDAGPEIGHAWRSRWDSLTLFTPSQYSSLPGMAFPSPRDTYPSKDDVASYLQAYASAFDLPVRLNAKVTSLTKRDGEYLVATADEGFTASQVVVATGPFQVPFVPPMADELHETVVQVHSADYRSRLNCPMATLVSRSPRNSPRRRRWISPLASEFLRSLSACSARTCFGGSPESDS